MPNTILQPGKSPAWGIPQLEKSPSSGNPQLGNPPVHEIPRHGDSLSITFSTIPRVFASFRKLSLRFKEQFGRQFNTTPLDLKFVKNYPNASVLGQSNRWNKMFNFLSKHRPIEFSIRMIWWLWHTWHVLYDMAITTN